LRALLLSQVEAVFPLASLLEHIKAREISTLDYLVNLATLNQHQLLLSLDLIDKHVLEFDGSDLASTVGSTVPFVSFGESLNGLVVVADRLEDLTSRLLSLDAHEARANYWYDFLYSILSISHSNIEDIHPNLLKVILVGEVLISDL